MFYWALYDWAVTPYNTVIVTFVFSAYFIKHIAQSAIDGTALLGYVNSIAAFLVAVISVTLGPVVDRAGGHKRWVAGFSLVAFVAAIALYFSYPSHSSFYWALVWFGVGLLAVEIVTVFYNAMLSKLFPPRVTGVLSGWGWGFSYLGGLACLFVILWMLFSAKHWFAIDIQDTIVPRLSGPVVAVWLLVFSLPFFMGCDEVKPVVKQKQSVGLVHKLIADIKAYPQVGLFLLARMFYMDGLNTTLAFGAIYAVGVFKIKLMQVLFFGISLNLIAGIGAIAFGFIEKHVGPKRMVQLGLTFMLLAMAVMLSASAFQWFWIFGCLYALCLGPIQSSSRSLLCTMCPPEIITEMFGFYSLSGRLTTFLGPLLLGVLTDVFSSQRIGMLSALGLMLIGWALLFWVRNERSNSNPLK